MKENTELIDNKITKKQSKFIDLYIDTANLTQAYEQAGFNITIPDKINSISNPKKRQHEIRQYIAVQAKELQRSAKIQAELKKRLEIRRLEDSARAGEVMFFLSEVMRGNIKDQFGLDAPLSERTRAAVELAKRTIDLENKLNGKETNPNIQISINWSRENQ
ncbi:MAG: terminase small subunit [Bacteroidales bacterium]|nr:terminase small subunit [Bacteroidales bacterium]